VDLKDWNDRYLAEAGEQAGTEPVALLVKTAERLAPGHALDLACGAGRNALWLAERGWRVAAVDGAEAAIGILRRQASERGLQIEARVADLENGGYAIEPESWDLIVFSYYLQRDLFEPARRGVKPGGLILAIVHITGAGEEPTYKRLRPGELQGYFAGWEILHAYEGQPNDAGHKYNVSEIVARRPAKAG
jgi:SAM-dependent methyltransferase